MQMPTVREVLRVRGMSGWMGIAYAGFSKAPDFLAVVALFLFEWMTTTTTTMATTTTAAMIPPYMPALLDDASDLDASPAGCVVPLAGCVVPLAGCVVPLAGCVVPLAGCVVPLAGCVVPLAGCVVPLAGCVVPPEGWEVVTAGCGEVTVAGCVVTVTSTHVPCEPIPPPLPNWQTRPGAHVLRTRVPDSLHGCPTVA
jgi:hypothetical protein